MGCARAAARNSTPRTYAVSADTHLHTQTLYSVVGFDCDCGVCEGFGFGQPGDGSHVRASVGAALAFSLRDVLMCLVGAMVSAWLTNARHVRVYVEVLDIDTCITCATLLAAQVANGAAAADAVVVLLLSGVARAAAKMAPGAIACARMMYALYSMTADGPGLPA